jgi:hypothetical protein
MRRLLLAGGALSAALALAGCHEDHQISGTITNPCNGENVTFSGVLHTEGHIVSQNPDSVHLQLHENSSDVKGSGSFGNNYTVPIAVNQVLTLGPGVTATERVTENVISSGSAPNFLIHELIHVTVDANGNIRALVDTFSAECKG